MSMVKSILFNRSVLGLLMGAVAIVGAMDLYFDQARAKILHATAVHIADDNVVLISQLNNLFQEQLPANSPLKNNPPSLISKLDKQLRELNGELTLSLLTLTSTKDAFQTQGFKAVSENPKRAFYKIEYLKDRTILRYITSNTSLTEGTGEARTALELDIDLTPYEEVAGVESAKVLWAMIITAILTITMLAIFLGRLRATSDSLAETNQTLEHTNKTLEQERIKELKRSEDLAAAKNETEAINRQLQTAIQELRTLVQEIQTSAGVINSAAGEIAVGNNDLSKRTDEQAAVLEETSASITELTSAVKQNVENAKQVRQMAELAYNVALKGGKAVSQVVNTMSTIHESSHKIVDIITVIDNIAFQTNMLALNAAVEAARAGEQGRGFGVVASEIRNLAQHTATAAKEIKGLISDSVEQIRMGTGLVDDAGHTMEEIMTSSKQVSDIIANIVSASIEQSTGIEQVNEAISRIDSTTQQNAALVRQSAAVAESLESHTRHMESLVNLFDSNKIMEDKKLTNEHQEALPEDLNEEPKDDIFSPDNDKLPSPPSDPSVDSPPKDRPSSE